MGHAHKDLTDQYAEQLREDVEYRREWCDKIGLGFNLPNYSQLSQPKPNAAARKESMKLLNLRGIGWSGRVDLNHRLPGPELWGRKT